TRREHVRHCQAAFQVLTGTPLEVLVQRRLTTGERRSIVELRIEQRNLELGAGRRHKALAFYLSQMAVPGFAQRLVGRRRVDQRLREGPAVTRAQLKLSVSLQSLVRLLQSG